jgi:hypothetical protein
MGFYHVALCLLAGALLTACSVVGGEPADTPTPTVADTPTRTPTPRPTATPWHGGRFSNNEPIPTRMPSPVPTPLRYRWHCNFRHLSDGTITAADCYWQPY